MKKLDQLMESAILRLALFFCLALFSSTAQSQIVQDDFSDGDFTSSPVWTGNTDKFQIAAGQLQLNDAVAAQSSLVTSFPSTTLNNKEWQVYVKETFAPSDNNHCRFYLTSSANVLSYTLNNSAGTTGYFLKIGEAGSSDVVKFCKDNGSGAIVELAAGVTNISSSVDRTYKVTRDAAGLWTVYSSNSTSTAFVAELSVTDLTYTSSTNLGLACLYTASNATKFYFDNIFFGDIVVDTTAPSLVSATATSSTTIDILFDEAVTFADVSSFDITGLGGPSTAVIDGANAALVHLTYALAFTANTTYTLSISQVEDLSGNVMPDDSTTFSWFVAAAAIYRDVVFNEVLADPAPQVGLPSAEYVEIFNRSSNAFDLGNWQFVNTTTVKILPTYSLQPGAHLILCDANNVSLMTTYGEVMGITSFSALTNGGDSLTLLNSSSEVIDILSYSLDWYATAVKADGGWSLELINPELPCQSASNWAESIDPTGGTPGQQNSVYSPAVDTTEPFILSQAILGTNQFSVTFSETMSFGSLSNLVISSVPSLTVASSTWNSDYTSIIITTNEILAPQQNYTVTISGPSDCSGNAMSLTNFILIQGVFPAAGDLIITEIYADESVGANPPSAPFGSEFIELYNRGTQLLELNGMSVNTAQNTQSYLLAPNEYVVIGDADHAASFTNISNKILIPTFPSLTNGGFTLTITNPTGDVLDELTYDLSWYHDNSKDEGGWSMELINPTLPCSGSANWSASTNASGSTPGTQNSIYSNTPDTFAPVLSTYTLVGPQELHLLFNEPLDAASLANIIVDIQPLVAISSITLTPSSDGIVINTTDIFELETAYSISVSGPSDCSGNQLGTTLLSIVRGYLPQAGDLLINEIYADPSPGTNEPALGAFPAEFVEIYNNSTHLIELQGVQLNSGIIEGSTLLPAHGYLVLADVDNALVILPFQHHATMASFPSLTNTQLTLTLKAADATVIDEVHYTMDWYHDANREDGGWSMELINPDAPCSDRWNWAASNDATGSTPGAQNSVYTSVIDIEAPQIVSTTTLSNSDVVVVFNEPLSFGSLSGLTWNVDGQVLNGSPLFSGGFADSLVLHFGTMTAGQIYHFTLSNVSDCWGNIATDLASTFVLAETPEVGDIIVNEILYNPRTGGYDFVELYNNSPRILSLQNWSLANEEDGTTANVKIITGRNYNLFPGEYLVLTTNGDALPFNYPFTHSDRILRMASLPSYNNGTGTVIALLPTGEISDRMVYDDAMHYPLLASTDGVSLERVAFDRSSMDATNWHSAAESQNFATPGYVNSQANAATLAEEALTISPEIFSPDNDGNQDIVTFSYKMDAPGYTANITLFDSEGRLMRHLMINELLGTSGSISWDGISDEKQLCPIGIYIVYFEVFSIDGKVSKTKKTCVLAHQLH